MKCKYNAQIYIITYSATWFKKRCGKRNCLSRILAYGGYVCVIEDLYYILLFSISFLFIFFFYFFFIIIICNVLRFYTKVSHRWNGMAWYTITYFYLLALITVINPRMPSIISDSLFRFGSLITPSLLGYAANTNTDIFQIYKWSRSGYLYSFNQMALRNILEVNVNWSSLLSLLLNIASLAKKQQIYNF